MRFVLNVLLVAAALVAVPANPANARPQENCGKLEKQTLAQREPKDWDHLYRLFRQSGACDDGAIAEQFSEDVAQLFSKQWSHVDKLNRIATDDKTFEQFVLRHINTTLDENELLVIADNSKSHCRAAEKRICDLVHARAQESLDTLRNVSE